MIAYRYNDANGHSPHGVIVTSGDAKVSFYYRTKEEADNKIIDTATIKFDKELSGAANNA